MLQSLDKTDIEKQEIAGALPYLFPLTKGNMRRKRRKTLEREIASPDFICGVFGAFEYKTGLPISKSGVPFSILTRQPISGESP